MGTNDYSQNEDNKVIQLNIDQASAVDQQCINCSQKKSREIRKEKELAQLAQWPIKIDLLPPQAPYFKEADLVIMADCVPAVYEAYRTELLSDNIIALGCPKLAKTEKYIKKLAHILWNNQLNSITIAYMELACCQQLEKIVKKAIKEAGVYLPQEIIEVGINGEQINN